MAKCENCGAPLHDSATQCRYCHSPVPPGAIQKKSWKRSKDPQTIQDKILVTLKLILVPVICAVGWVFENPMGWWNNDTAVAVWIGILPLWCLISGWFTSVREYAVRTAVGFFFLSGTSMLTGTAIRLGGRINDDAMGISLVMAVSAMGAYSLGVALKRHVMK